MTNQGSVAYVSAKINNGADGSTGAASKQLLNTTQSPLSYTDLATAFSISLWVKPNQTLTGTDCYWGGVVPSNGVLQKYLDALFTSATNTIRFRHGDSLGNTFFDTTINPASGTWYHLVITYSGSTIKTYVNNTNTSSGSYTPAVGYAATTTSSSVLGPDGGVSSQPVNAVIDEYGFWTRELTSGEVSSLYNGGVGLQYPFTTVLKSSNCLLMGV
jgi:hypothetical protein